MTTQTTSEHRSYTFLRDAIALQTPATFFPAATAGRGAWSAVAVPPPMFTAEQARTAPSKLHQISY